MKIIDLSPLRTDAKQGKRQEAPWQARLQAIFKYGWGWYQAYQAQDKVIRVLDSVLDHRFVLIRGLKLTENAPPLPPILVGPPGVFLLYVWPKSGSYRIREGQWEIMQGKPRRYRPGKPNVVREVLRLKQKVAAFFSKALQKDVAVKPLMVFADTGADVASVRPMVRPLLLDGLKRYAAQLAKEATVLTPTDMVALTEAVRPRPAQLAAKKKKQQAHRRRKVAQPPPQVQKAATYFNFTPRQWMILGGLAVFILFMLMGAIMYVLLTVH